MIRAAPPLRFLLLVVGVWVCGRGALLALEEGAAGPRPPVRTRDQPVRVAAAEMPVMPAAMPPRARPAPAVRFVRAGVAAPIARRGDQPEVAAHPLAAPMPLVLAPPRPQLAASALPPAIAPSPRAPVAQGLPSRWSASAWTHVRRGGGAGEGALAPGGMLGGSQAGARISYRLFDSVSVTARAYAPLGRTQAAEAALGLEWQPLPSVPIRLLAERRQRIGGEGRSDFALTAHGGVSDVRLPAGLRLDAYGQAGVVGVERRDLFADGAARIAATQGPVDIGGGVWAAAQPGVARVDVGPSLGLRLPVAGASLRVLADWRFRIAGDAAPGSGPSLTIGTDF